MSTDPWASANTQNSAPASSGLGGDLPAGPPSSGLFGGDEFERHPGLFDKFTPPNTTFRGTLIEVREIHSTCHPSKSPDRQTRLKEYWQDNAETGKTEKVTNPMNPWTREANRKVMDQVVIIQTDLRDPSNDDDTGVRAWFVSGAKNLKNYTSGTPNTSSRGVLLDAARSAGITDDSGWADKPIEVTRHNREDPRSDTSLWLWSCKIG